MTDARERPTGSAWQLYVPPVRWLAEYQAKWLPRDAIAGVTLAAYAIPVSLAYATLAGLPPQVGIYGYLLGGVGYALLGGSRQLAIGPPRRQHGMACRLRSDDWISLFMVLPVECWQPIQSLMVRGNGPFTLVERYDRKRKFAAYHSVDALNRNASSALAGDGHVFVAAAAPAIGLWRRSHDFIGFDPAIGGSLRIIQ